MQQFYLRYAQGLHQTVQMRCQQSPHHSLIPLRSPLLPHQIQHRLNRPPLLICFQNLSFLVCLNLFYRENCPASAWLYFLPLVLVFPTISCKGKSKGQNFKSWFKLSSKIPFRPAFCIKIDVVHITFECQRIAAFTWRKLWLLTDHLLSFPFFAYILLLAEIFFAFDVLDYGKQYLLLHFSKNKPFLWNSRKRHWKFDEYSDQKIRWPLNSYKNLNSI